MATYLDTPGGSYHLEQIIKGAQERRLAPHPSRCRHLRAHGERHRGSEDPTSDVVVADERLGGLLRSYRRSA